MEKTFESPFGGLHISDDRQKLDVSLIHHFLKNSYWAENIPLEVVEKAINNATCFGVYLNEKQIGFARVVSDKATFAYLADVFIIEEFRGKGFSKKLMECVHAHPDLQGLRRWMLVTRDAHPLYQQFGWTGIPNPERFMQKHQPSIYQPTTG